MKVALIAQRFLPYTGGIELHVAALAAQLAQAGDQVVVVTREKRAMRPQPERGSVDVELRCVRSWFGVHTVLREYSPDVVHAHGARSAYTALAALVAYTSGFPLVFTPHCFYPKWNIRSWVKKTLFDILLGSPLLRRASRTICLTERDRSDAVALGAPAQRTVVIPAPSSLPLPRSIAPDPSWRARTGVDRFLLFVGRLAPAKRVDFLIQAMRELDGSGLQLVVIGPDDGARSELDDMARALGVADRVHFLGPVSRDDLQAAYANCELLVLPSAFEGQPVVLLEAMAFGKVVLASDAGGNNQVVRHGENGFLFPVDDLYAFCQIVRRCLKEDMTAIRAQARATVLARYSWPVIIPRMRTVYKEAVIAHGERTQTP